MPGPVSDSYDPEFGTGANAADVREAITEVRNKISQAIGNDELQNIVHLAQSENDSPRDSRVLILYERELRILRFALNRALESI